MKLQGRPKKNVEKKLFEVCGADNVNDRISRVDNVMNLFIMRCERVLFYQFSFSFSR